MCVAQLLVTEPGKEFRWRGSLFGLYNGEHYFKLQAKGPDQCDLVHGEEFSGVLVPFLNGPNMAAKQGFYDFNQAIKRRAETTN